MNQTNNRHLRIGKTVDRIRRRIVLLVLAAHFVSAFMVLFSVSPFTNQVAAWCEPDAHPIGLPGVTRDTFTEECKLDNLREIEKLAPDRVLSPTDYDKKINDCTNGNAGGWDLGFGEFAISDDEQKARCANAILTCQKSAIDTVDCTPDNLKTIAGSQCNSGQLSDNGNDNCPRLQEMNQAHVDDIKGDVCIGESNNADGAQATSDCVSAVSDKCLQDILNDDGTVRGNSFEDAKKCAESESRGLAQSQEVCTIRGGKWTPKQGPALSGQSLGGACVAAPPTTPTDPCEGHGGTNAATGKCNDGTDPKEADCPKVPGTNTCATIGRVSDRCGEARVNIIVCGEDGGNVALNNVLKIVVMVLSITVGVAAVGGLAWAAVLYSKAEDNEGNVTEAKTLIRNIVIGLLAYVFLIALINWLVPGAVIT